MQIKQIFDGFSKQYSSFVMDAYEVKVNKDIFKYVSGKAKTNLSILEIFYIFQWLFRVCFIPKNTCKITLKRLHPFLGTVKSLGLKKHVKLIESDRISIK